MTGENVKHDEWTLVRSLKSDQVYVVKTTHWADFKWDMKTIATKEWEVVTSGEKGYLTMLEQLANDETTKDYK